MKNLAIRILLAFAAGALVFWLYKGGVQLNALMTQRTPLYFEVHAIGAWIVSVLVGFVIFVQRSDRGAPVRSLHQRKGNTMKNVWIPEAPEHPGLYANHDGTDLDTSKIRGLVKQPSTMDPKHALQFATREGCQAWCDANPHPVFVPREHGFGDPV